MAERSRAPLTLANSGLAADREFEALFREHYPRLVRILIRLVGGAGRAEELASDAFCRLYQRHGALDSEQNLAGWLYRTAVNLGLDDLRSASRRTRREEQAGRAEAGDRSHSNPLGDLLAEEQRMRVRTALCRLKPVQGQVLLMSSSGFTCREIAEVLGMRPDSLYMLISRAKAQFEKEYVGLYGRGE